MTAVRTSAERAERNPDELRFGALILVCLAENDDVAWQFAQTPQVAWASCWTAGIQSGQTWKQWGFEHPFGNDASWPKNMKNDALPREFIDSLPGLVPDAVTDRTVIWGGAARIADRMRPYLDAGINEVTFLNMATWSDPSYGLHFGGHASDVITRLGGAPLKL